MVWVCVISLFLQTVVVYALNSSDDSISKETIVENNTSSQSDDSIDISDIYENNVIKIYNTKTASSNWLQIQLLHLQIMMKVITVLVNKFQ